MRLATAARSAGTDAARDVGVGKEWFDEFQGWAFRDGHYYDPEDLAANEVGINAPPGVDCQSYCSEKLAPPCSGRPE